MLLFQDFDFNEIFLSEKSILTLFCMYPSRDRFRIIDYIKIISIGILTIIYTSSIALSVCFATVNEVVLTLSYIGKMGYFIIKGRHILKCEELMKTCSFRAVPKATWKTINKNTRDVIALGNYYRRCCIAYVIVGAAFTVVYMKQLELLIFSWWPFEINKYYIYFALNIFQSLALLQTSLANSSIDIIFYKFSTILYCQLEILNENLNSIDYAGNEKVVKEKFRGCIIHHYKLHE